MQVNIIVQRENINTIADAMSKCLEKGAKKAYFFAGNFKETGYKIIEEEIIDIDTKLFFVIGIDKKNTTRNMLEGLLQYTKDVYYHSNNSVNEFVANVSVFEYTDSAVMYVSSSNISESGIQTDTALFVETIYNLKDASDKAIYKKQIKDLTKLTESEGFELLNKSAIEKLVQDKEIFSTRQYNHSVMSISELLGKPSQKVKVQKDEKIKEVEESILPKDIEIPKVDLSDISIDIDIDIPESIEVEIPKKAKKKELDIDYEEEKVSLPDDIEKYEENNDIEDTKIDKNNELYDESLNNGGIDLDSTLDINNLLFSKADVSLDVKSKKPKKTTPKKKDEVVEDDIVKVKKVNLNNITNLMFELPTKNSKEEDTIRVPNHIRTMIPEFFGLDEAKNTEINGTTYKVKEVEMEVVEAKTSTKYKDKNSKIMYKSGQSYLTFVTDVLKNVHYEDDDIVRIIKLSDKVYHIEVIDKDLQEYKIWKKLCNQKFRASTKNFGVM